MKLEEKLKSAIAAGIEKLYGQKPDERRITFQKTNKDFEGDITMVVFPFTGISKKSPEQTANDIGNYLKENLAEVENFNVVKGFLNLVISSSFWLDFFNSATQKEHYGFAAANSGKTIMVEYSSPNTNKPLHLGHIRNNLLGYSVAEILKANGHKVIKVQVINDRGIHICKSMLAWQKWGNLPAGSQGGETPESSGMKGDKLVGKYYVEFDKHYKAEIAELVAKGLTKEEAEKQAPSIIEAQAMLLKWEAKDPEVYALWEKMNGWVYDGFDITYKNLGVDFDRLYYESETWLRGKEEVLKGLEQGIFIRKEGQSVWVDLTKDGLDEKVLLRSDGTTVYMTQDIGTAILRYRDFPELDRIVYTVGSEQEYHFKVLFLILQKLGFQWAKNCYHLSYGMVDLPSGKMKSREGTVVDADDLMEEMIATAKEISLEKGKGEDISEAEATELYRMIGMAALKYFILKVDPKKKMLFNPQESIDINGHTGPFIQYTHARISSLLRKADTFPSKTVNTSLLILSKEKELLKLIHQFPAVLKEAGDEYSPALLANYIYELAKEYNQFYHDFPVLKEADESKKNFRLQLTGITGKIIADSLKLLGIQAPDKM